MCEGFLLKVERLSPITLTYNESSSARAYWNNPCTQQASKRINLQRNNHNTQKRGERDRFGATTVHCQPKEIYINFFQGQRKLWKEGQHIDTYKSKDLPLEIFCLIIYDQLTIRHITFFQKEINYFGGLLSSVIPTKKGRNQGKREEEQIEANWVSTKTGTSDATRCERLLSELAQ